jgi:hypothetical protein
VVQTDRQTWAVDLSSPQLQTYAHFSVVVFVLQEGNENWKNRKDGQIDCSWPLCSQGKVIIHLTELDRSSLPAGKLGRGDFYFHISRPCQTKSPNLGLCLCLKLRTLSGEALEVRIPPAHLSMAFSQKWFQETIFRSSDTRLLSALQFCVVSFERSIDRIELQLLASGLRMDQRLPSSHSDAVATSDLPLSAKDNELLSSACLVADECQCLCGIINSSSQSTTADDSHFHRKKRPNFSQTTIRQMTISLNFEIFRDRTAKKFNFFFNGILQSGPKKLNFYYYYKIGQSINQSINQSMVQPINISTICVINQSINRRIDLSIDQLLDFEKKSSFL